MKKKQKISETYAEKIARLEKTYESDWKPELNDEDDDDVKNR